MEIGILDDANTQLHIQSCNDTLVIESLMLIGIVLQVQLCLLQWLIPMIQV